MKKISCLIILVAIFIVGGCMKETSTAEIVGFMKETNPRVVIEMENGQEMYLELFVEVTPITVNNFLKLVDEGFYNGLTFHRIIKNFMIQGGDPSGDGTGGSKDKIFGEFKKNGFENNIPHIKGVISMARSQNNDSASSQFFICHEEAKHLNGGYAAFGYLYDGIDCLDEIANSKTGSQDYPKEKVVIKQITRVIEK